MTKNSRKIDLLAFKSSLYFELHFRCLFYLFYNFLFCDVLNLSPDIFPELDTLPICNVGVGYSDNLFFPN